MDSGQALATIKGEHERYVSSHKVFGVPTFVVGDQAVFVRHLSRSPVGTDPASSSGIIERTVDLVAGCRT